jgi:hypothetical protein
VTVGIDAHRVAERLGSQPLTLRDAVAADTAGGLPAKPGFYGWWIERDTIATVPHHPHPTQPELGLLYVGISPKRPGSSGLIRSRVIDQHVHGNVSSSTFRFVLASMLLDHLRLQPRAALKKIVLDRADNERLRQWQFDHLWVTWCERERPWEVEDAVIALMQPPLNSVANRAHPFHATLGSARAHFRAATRTP